MADREKQPLRVRAGQFINLAGLVLFPVGLGAVGGFYAADQGMRWLPSMLQIVMALVVVSLLAMAAGRWLAREAVVETSRGWRVRRRVIACLALALLGLLAQLGVYIARQPTGLTALGERDFNRAFALDVQRYREYEQGLEGLLVRLERAGFLTAGQDQVLKADQERLLREIWIAFRAFALNLDRIRVFYEGFWRFDISRAERSYHLRAFLLTYAAELALHEKAARWTTLVLGNNSARKFLNTPSPAHGLPKNSFSLLRQELLGVRDQGRVLAGRNYLAVLEQGLGAREEALALNLGWLRDRVSRHLRLIRQVSTLDSGLRTIRADLQLFKRAVRRVWFPAQKGVAEWTGDTRVRRIGWYLIGQPQLKQMDARLEPGDIMLSRKNWYLSNIALPGFWPHAILYLGDPKKLGRYFDTPEVNAWVAQQDGGRHKTLAGLLRGRWPGHWRRYELGQKGHPNRVLEAISEGVVFNTLGHAAGDYFAALRPRLSRLDKARAVLEAFRHVGKPYDFDFDFATDHALVCTELVWRAYRPDGDKQGLNLPLTRVAGRMTLPANEIARLFKARRGKAGADLSFAYFIDASEKQRHAFAADEATFLESVDRPQWDIVQK